MKKFIIPIILSILFMGGAKQLNSELNVVGFLLAIMLGVGIGVAINSLLFKVKKIEQ